MKSEPLNLYTIRERLATTHGKQYWRSLEEIADTKEFQEFVHREFPAQASEWYDEISRRQFLKIMGASLALAGFGACMKMPEEKIVPYVRQPEEIIPGKPLFFATAVTLGGYATGLLVESHEGRPTKIEGNPRHPASLGATDIFAQASILSLYDPDRSQVVNNAGQISTWSEFLAVLRTEMEHQKAGEGGGLRILTETTSSPTLAGQIAAVLEKYPRTKWHQYEPLTRDNVFEGVRLAFGEAVETRYHFDKADMILALDADFLFSGPGWVRYAREFADKRRMRTGQSAMNRLYVVEPIPSTTGAMADHRLAVRASLVEDFTRAIAKELGIVTEAKASTDESHDRWIKAAVRDLQQHRGTSVVLAGDQQPPAVHAMVHAINEALGNTNQTVVHTESVAARPVNQLESLRELVRDMNAGVVETLMILGGNPAYNAPVDFHFAEAMSKVKLRVHLGLNEDETSQLCHLHIPETHYLETWSDARAFDGTATILQPLIAPLYDGKSAHEFVAARLGHADQSSHDIVRGYWRTHASMDDNTWHTALHEGVVPGTVFEPKSVSLRPIQKTEQGVTSGIELVFLPDSTIGDGRFANNGWLQELPKPLTRLTWDNAALMSPATGEKLGVSNEDVVELQLAGQTLRVPVWIVPGQADQTVVVTLGYGRTHAGHVGNGAGFNAYSLRPVGRALGCARTGNPQDG